jgi:HEAT repeat protein
MHHRIHFWKCDWKLIVTRAFSIISKASLVSICLVCTLFGQTVPYPSESASALVQQFENTRYSGKNFEVAKKIVALRDKSVLKELAPELSNMDMHRRGNAAFIFASLGDDRGFQVIKAILEDRSSKRAVFEMGSIGGPSPDLQIRQDRYYAVYLFGHLKDSRAVPILLPLLNDEDLKFAVVFSLGQIGDKCAIPPLINILGDIRRPYMRLLVIRALEQLDAKEAALPMLHALIDDGSAYFDISVPLAAAARTAIDTLEQKP